jgi:fructuronate reductase
VAALPVQVRRLSRATLADAPSGVARPAYDAARVTAGIVHLGIGAFHRAHMAAMTDAVLGAQAAAWGIIGASLRSPDTRDALAPQDGLYTLAVRSGAGESLRVIGAVHGLIVAPEDPSGLVAAMADPAIRIVSLTVTEKGYCHDPATGELNEDHPDIRHDLAHPDQPRTAPGFLVAALARRRAAGVPPFTVLSCDNLPANGRTTRRVLTRLAALREPSLGRWVEATLACPSSMVDRIVPATTDEDRAGVAAALGLADAWPVVAEPFSQWVIEDHFPLGRPRWEIAGATFVPDVAPYERMKLRMLNGAHSTMAYLGALRGHSFVFEAARDPHIVAIVEGLWGEVIPTLPAEAGLEPLRYAADLMARFRNPAIRHKLLQIAMDGSQKLPQRLVSTLRERRAAGAPFDHLALAIAAFLRFLRTRPEDVRDPLAGRFAEQVAQGGAFAGLGVAEVFGDLAGDPLLADAVAAADRRLDG